MNESMQVARLMVLICLAFVLPPAAHALPAGDKAPGPVDSSGQLVPAVPASGLSAPASASGTGPVLQENIVKDSALTPQESSIESFFQVNPVTRNSRTNVLMQPAVVEPQSTHKKRSLPYYFYRGVWHILDNAGVPMFFGQDSCIDPSLNSSYLILSPKLPSEKAAAKEIEQQTGSTTSQPPPAKISPQPAPQKIPESELEGVPLPAPRDDVHD